MALDEDLHEKMVQLAKSLLAGTREGKVAWTPTDSESMFLCSGTRSSVTIESNEYQDVGRVSTLRLLNERGTVVDSLHSEEDASHPGFIRTAEWNEVLEDLFHAARRVAYNVDEAIDSMLADIEAGISAPPGQGAKKKRNEDPWAREDPWKTDNAGYSDEPPF